MYEEVKVPTVLDVTSPAVIRGITNGKKIVKEVSISSRRRLTMKDFVVEPSIIEQAGNGVFTKRFIKKGEIIGEYYGTYIKKGEKISDEMSMYLYCNSQDETMIPDRKCKARFINDAIDIDQTIHEVYQVALGESGDKMINSAAIRKAVRIVCDPYPPVHFSEAWSDLYNVDWKEKGKRVFIKSTRDIEEGEELFIFYGMDYWMSEIRESILASEREHLKKSKGSEANCLGPDC